MTNNFEFPIIKRIINNLAKFRSLILEYYLIFEICYLLFIIFASLQLKTIISRPRKNIKKGLTYCPGH